MVQNDRTTELIIRKLCGANHRTTKERKPCHTNEKKKQNRKKKKNHLNHTKTAQTNERIVFSPFPANVGTLPSTSHHKCILCADSLLLRRQFLAQPVSALSPCNCNMKFIRLTGQLTLETRTSTIVDVLQCNYSRRYAHVPQAHPVPASKQST